MVEYIYKERKLTIHINDLLKKYNMTQAELARLADIDHPKLSNLQNGKRKHLYIEHLLKIAEALDIDDINEILTIEKVKEH